MPARLFRMGYYFVMWCYHAAVRCAALVHTKAHLRVQGARVAISDMARSRQPDVQYIWFHCASLGEFEQGRPVIERIKHECPSYHIALTFYSPSGYTVRRNYPMVDWVGYLPDDTMANARRWVAHLRPALAIFVKYEFWYGYLSALHEADVPVWLISATFRRGQWLFRPMGSVIRQSLSRFENIFVQDRASAELLAEMMSYSATVAGDTRVDRVADIPATAAEIPVVSDWVAGAPALVAGSTWPPDDALIAAVAPRQMPYARLIIVPHETDYAHASACRRTYMRAYGAAAVVLLSEVVDQVPPTARVLIIDRIGWLSALYRYAHIVYIGGGFGRGIHNILEPAAWSRPLAFGPHYDKFNEAVRMVESGGARSVAGAKDFEQWLHDMQQPDKHQTAAEAVGRYIRFNQGATARIIQVFKDRFSCV